MVKFILVFILNMSQGIAIPLAIPSFKTMEDCVAAGNDRAIDETARARLACIEVRPEEKEI